ncbi:MAG TPA: aspartyl/asparaginyl beta-hydroxylase domain-containing protein [Sphingomicrobium sp.]|nr:aspartyl/asparaginyl beta-hydroxylase domain-containing protein [Sphingomicrobium sp.]
MADDAITLEQAADRAATSGDPAAASRLLEQAVAQAGDKPGLWVKLSAMRRAGGDLGGALEAVERALAIEPLNFSALLSRAFLLEGSGDPRAGEAFAVAVAQAPPDESLPKPVASALEHARQRSAEHGAAVERRLRDAVGMDLPAAERARVERFVANTARRTRHFHQEPSHFHFPGLPEVEFHDREEFPGLEALEARTGEIRAEFQALVASEAAQLVPYIQYPDNVPLRQWKELNRNRQWTAIHLVQNGQRVEANARHCPRTLEAVSAFSQPQVPGASPNAMFSLLAPRTRIPPHTGVANTRLVCHLALIVPPECGFRVGATTVEWKEGTAFVFDDTIEHEAWNDSDQLRVVLIFDLWAPALSDAERRAVAAIIPAAGVGFGGGI